MATKIISATKPALATLVLENETLLVCTSKGRQEVKDYQYLGEVTFEYGNGVPYVHAEEKVRLPLANASLSVRITNLNSRESCNYMKNLEDMPPWDPNAIYSEILRYYQIDEEKVHEHLRSLIVAGEITE